MVKRILLAGLVAGIALYVWESLAHMVLPLGELGVRGLGNEAAIIAAVKNFKLREPHWPCLKLHSRQVATRPFLSSRAAP